MKELFAVDLKSLFRGLVLSIIGTAFILCLFFISYGLVFNLVSSNPQKVKNIAERSSLYEDLPAIIYSQAADSTENSVSGIPLRDPEIRQIALDVYNPSLARSNIEKLIDGVYAWLNGQAQKPDVAIDLSEANSEFISRIGDYTRQRVRELPVCNASQLNSLEESTVLELECRPATLTPAKAGEEAERLLKESEGFLPENKLNLDDLKSKDGQPLYQSLENLPKSFSTAKTIPWVLAVLTLILIVVIFHLSKDKVDGLKRLSRLTGLAGIFITFIPVMFLTVSKALINNSSQNDQIGNLVLTLFEQFMAEAGKIYYSMGILLLATAIGLYIYARKIHNNDDKITKAKS